MKKVPIRIEGKKVVLRQLKLSDAPLVQKYLKDPVMTKWTLNIPYPYPKNGGVKFIAKARSLKRRNKAIVYAITQKDSDNIVGVISFQDFNWPDKCAELGYWLGKPFWGKGLMTDATQLMLDLGFRVLKLHKIKAGVFADNPASIKVLMKNGLKREGVLRHRRMRFGKWRDTVLLAILETEF